MTIGENPASNWPIWSTSSTYAPPITFTSGTSYYIAEVTGDRSGIHGVGKTRREAIADLRAAIAEFACVMGVATCKHHKEKP